MRRVIGILRLSIIIVAVAFMTIIFINLFTEANLNMLSWLFGILLVILLSIVFIKWLKIKRRHRTILGRVRHEIGDEVHDYAQTHLEKGFSPDTIKAVLIKAGHPTKQVNQVLFEQQLKSRVRKTFAKREKHNDPDVKIYDKTIDRIEVTPELQEKLDKVSERIRKDLDKLGFETTHHKRKRRKR